MRDGDTSQPVTPDISTLAVSEMTEVDARAPPESIESWTIKKAECQRIDAFELWCWIRLLRVSWTARRSSQSILKEISLAYSL